MAKMDATDFVNYRPGGGGTFINLKKEPGNKTIGVIHPDGGIHVRKRHGMIAYDDENSNDGMSRYSPNCGEDGCPFCLLKEWAEIQIKTNPDLADVVVLSGGRGKKAIAFTLNELAGNGDWRTKAMDVRTNIVVAWVPTDNFDADRPVKILDGPPGLLSAVQNVIKKSIKMQGEVEGNPIKNPYPMMLAFDEHAKPADKYQADRAVGRHAEIDADVQRVLDTPLDDDDIKIDLDKISGPGDSAKMMEALDNAWVTNDVSFDEFKAFVEQRQAGGTRPTGSTRRKPSSRRKSADEEAPVEEVPVASATCSKCGEELNGARFCPNCGTPADEAPAEDSPKATGNRRRRTSGKAAGKDNKPRVVYCDECEEDVTLTSEGRCPNCARDYDVV